MTALFVPPRVDVVFPLAAEALPVDHGYALFTALCRILGDLHGASWLAIHPVSGTPAPGDMLTLEGAHLRLRVIPAEMARVLPLTGASLEVDGRRVRLGAPRLEALNPASIVQTRVATIKGCIEPEPFEAAVRGQLQSDGVSAVIAVGARRRIAIGRERVTGYALTLSELSPEDSLLVQYRGVGGRQRMGCGIFAPPVQR